MKHQITINDIETLLILDGLNPDHFEHEADKAKAAKLHHEILEIVRKDFAERDAAYAQSVAIELSAANVVRNINNTDLVCPMCGHKVENYYMLNPGDKMYCLFCGNVLGVKE